MTELRSRLDQSPQLSSLAERVRADVPALVKRFVEEIQSDVPAYSGPATGDRHRLISMAVEAAVNQFLDLLQHDDGIRPRVDELFRQMGHGEAHDGNNLEPMRSALRIATRQSWNALRTFAAEQSLSAPLLSQIADALFAYLDHLDEQVTQGFAWGVQAFASDRERARARLLEWLLSDRSRAAGDLETLAARADWSVPSEVVILSATFHGAFPALDLPDELLLRTDLSPAVLVSPARDAARVVDLVSRSAPGMRVAVSWPVSAEDTPHAHRWTKSALSLVDRGVLPPVPIIECSAHTTQLWLHSEPLVRRHLTQSLLHPLLAETPNSREILAETLLAWLESRDSAPAIAAKLGVHPQTVRYRWKRINGLFGELLQNPEFVIQVTMLLKSSVPLWKAGDQSDFERFSASGENEER